MKKVSDSEDLHIKVCFYRVTPEALWNCNSCNSYVLKDSLNPTTTERPHVFSMREASTHNIASNI